jgi:hypothetical protein
LGGVGRRLATFLRFFETGMGVKANTQKPILSNAGDRCGGTLWRKTRAG